MATYVLVHGSWHGGWCWAPVAARLTEKGHVALAPTMPGHGVNSERAGVTNEDCINALVAFIEQRDLNKVILLGHSWGGTVVSGAAPRVIERLERLIYLNAFVLEPGECVLDVLPPQYVEAFGKLATTTSDGSIPLPFEIWQQAFMQDAGEEAQRIVHCLLSPEPSGVNTTKNPVAVRDLDVALSYINAKQDLALPPGEFAWCPRFPQRLGEHRFVELDGSHEACLTRPAELAKAILDASAIW